jgi:hypothetical protein
MTTATTVTYQELLTYMFENPQSSAQDLCEAFDDIEDPEKLEGVLYDLEDDGVLNSVLVTEDGTFFSTNTDESLEAMLEGAESVLHLNECIFNKDTNIKEGDVTTATEAKPKAKKKATKKAKKKTTKKASKKAKTTKKKAKGKTTKKASTSKKKATKKAKKSTKKAPAKGKGKKVAKKAKKSKKKDEEVVATKKRKVSLRASWDGDYTDPETGEVSKNIQLKRCVDCKEVFPKFTHFRPRWGKDYDESATGVVTDPKHVQPRCNSEGNNCDTARSQRKSKFVAMQKLVVVHDFEESTVFHPKGEKDGAFTIVEIRDHLYTPDLRGALVAMAAAAGLRIRWTTDNPNIEGTTKKAVKAVKAPPKPEPKPKKEKKAKKKAGKKKATKTTKKATKKKATKKKVTKKKAKKATGKKAKTVKKTTKKATKPKVKKPKPKKRTPEEEKARSEKIAASMRESFGDDAMTAENEW